MNAVELRSLLDAGAGSHLELLPEKAPARRIQETLVAFANAAGGILVLGAPAGLADPPAARQRVMDLALQTDPPLVMPIPELTALDGATILVVVTPAGLPHVYSADGRYLRRVGPRNEALAGPALRELLLGRSEPAFEAEALLDASLDDLEMRHVEQYAEALGAVGRPLTDLLLSRGCLRVVAGRLTPTVAGALLFGRDPQRFTPAAEILAIRYAGSEMSDEFIKEQIRGPLPEQIRRAVGFVEQTTARAARLNAMQRQERRQYPPAAVREAIVNAVAHRDYRQRGDAIRLFIFADRIECYSPGRLPGHVTVENILRERFSRNEVLVQALSDLGFIERLGYGIDRMVALMEQEGLPAPIFEETPAGFRVTLRGPLGVGAPVNLSRAAGRWVHLDLNPRQEGAVRFAEEHGRITNRDLKQLFPDVSDETIRRDLAELVGKNLLLKIGDKRATFYILK